VLRVARLTDLSKRPKKDRPAGRTR